MAAIKFGPREKIEAAVKKIAGRMDEKVHIRQYQAYILSVASTVIQLVQQYDRNLSEIMGTDRDYFRCRGRWTGRRIFTSGCWEWPAASGTPWARNGTTPPKT